MRRMRRLRARLLASRSGIRSPVYSAIFFPRWKWTVAKQPLPLIGDLRIERPCASFTDHHCTTTRNEFTAEGVLVSSMWHAHLARGIHGRDARATLSN